MKKIVDFPDRKIIEQEAVDWLIKLDSDTAPTEEDLQALKEWMSRSPAHVEELDKLNAFWSDLSVLTELNIPLVKPSVLAMAKRKQQKPASSKVPFYRGGWAVAASVLGIALLVQQLIMPGAFWGKPLDSTNGRYETAVGKQSIIPLADGSTMYLNTNSQIDVEYIEGFRNIHLVQGEAHFDVAKDEDQPFRVYAGQGRVQAVGTSFTVYLRDKDVEVLVTEGKVELATQKPVPVAELPSVESEQTKSAELAGVPVDTSSPNYYLTLPVEKLGLLAEGQRTTLLVAQNNKPGQNPKPHKVELLDAETLERREAWRKGLVLFAGDSLEEVVSEIGRYTTLSIEIVDPELKKIRIGGQFRLGDVDGMFKVLETNFGLSITMLDSNRVQISSAEKNN